MELNDLLLLAAASLLPHFCPSPHARESAVKEAKLLWKEVLKQEREE
jgi:hypothetical protein